MKIRRIAFARRSGVALGSVALAGALLLAFANTASAAVVTKVPLATAANYAVLGGQSVTNTGNTTMNENLGLAPGLAAAITGFPPGIVNAPGVTDVAGGAQAQLDLTTAFNNAAGRSLTATEPADLKGLTLQGGVYAATAKAPLALNGTVTLDGAGNPNTVFIFQTDSTLKTAAASRVSLINGAQECNVYWEVLSSATLGAGSTFVGNILAHVTITMGNAVTVHGRALASTGSVTLINDHFSAPTCATVLPTTTTSSSVVTPTTGPPVGAGPTTTVAGGSSTTLPGGSTTTLPGAGAGGGSGGAATTTTLGLTVGIVGPPHTGVAPLPADHFPWPAILVAGVAGAGAAAYLARRRFGGGSHSVPR